MSSQKHMSKNIIFDIGGVLFERNVQADLPDQKLFLPIKEGIALLDDCFQAAQKDGHLLFICSNFSMRYIEILEEEFPHIIERFEGIVTPTTAQAKKPDPQIFNYLLSTYNLVPEHSIFIDDQLLNIQAAQNVGISGIHLESYQDVRNQLKQLGVLAHIR